MITALEGWLKVSLTVSSEALLSVAFHQLSKTTSSKGHSRPVDFMVRLLSGVMIEILLPFPIASSQLSVIANIVLWSDTMSISIPEMSNFR